MLEQAGELTRLLEKKYIADLVSKYKLVLPETEKTDKKVGGKKYLVNWIIKRD
jgi:hypothetical protein